VHTMIDEDGGQYRWRLVRHIRNGAEVVARGVPAYPDERACHEAADLLAEIKKYPTRTVQQPDGHWQWVVAGPDGEPFAESPAVFRDAAACVRALADLRREIDASHVAGPLAVPLILS
jgi:hypothetical protein